MRAQRVTAQRARVKLFVAVIGRFALGVKLPRASRAIRLRWRSSLRPLTVRFSTRTLVPAVRNVAWPAANGTGAVLLGARAPGGTKYQAIASVPAVSAVKP